MNAPEEMMKRVYVIIKSILTVLILCQAVGAYASPQKGKHYDKVEDCFTQESLGVEKFFSLTCRPCWKLSTILPTISEQSKQPIYQTHVVFNDVTRAAATLYYSAAIQVKSLPHDFVSALFLLVQADASVAGTTLTSLFHRYQLTPINQLTAEQQAQVRVQLVRAEKLTAQAHIMQIPTIVVDGRYKINMRAHKSIPELSETIKQLAERSS